MFLILDPGDGFFGFEKALICVKKRSVVPDDTVREVIEIAKSAGISEDVVLLLEIKAAHLADQVASLEQQNAALAEKNQNLATEVKMLKGQLQNSGGKGNELEAVTWDILKYFFHKGGEVSDLEVSQHFSMHLKTASYHTEILFRKKLIEVTCEEIQTWHGNCPPLYSITEEGKTYIRTTPAPVRSKV